MTYEYKFPVVRDGWGRSRVSYYPKSDPHWIDRRNGALYKSDGRWVSRAIHRYGKLCWAHDGAVFDRRFYVPEQRIHHAVRNLIQQYHEGMSQALDEDRWRRDIIAI